MSVEDNNLAICKYLSMYVFQNVERLSRVQYQHFIHLK